MRERRSGWTSALTPCDRRRRSPGDFACARRSGRVSGFSALYRRLLVRRPPLDAFGTASPRVLLRPTRHYLEAITGSVQSERLASSGQRRHVIDLALSDPPAALRDHPAVANAVRAAEHSALARLEVPRFSMPATGGPLGMGGRRLGSPFRDAPLARAQRFMSEMRLSALGGHRRAVADAIRAVASGEDVVPFT